jgi:hypothetical protein
MSLYGDILQANFFLNSINRQINGDLEPLKGFGINFLGHITLIYLYISLIMIKQGGDH